MKSKKTDEGNNTFGLALVMCSLAFDGLTQTQTDMNHKKSKRDFAYPGMLVNNLVGLLFSGSFYVFSVVQYGENSHQRVLGDTKLLYDCVMVGLSGSIG